MMQLADYFACQVSLIEKSNPFKTKTKTPNRWGKKGNKGKKKEKKKEGKEQFLKTEEVLLLEITRSQILLAKLLKYCSCERA